jgi:hypothetical protein
MLDIKALSKAWCAETAAAQTVKWEMAPIVVGQCAVTALLVQDECGGEILRADVCGQGHYWNLIPAMGEIDLTREQFGAAVEIPRGIIVPRSRLLEGERAIAARTQERYIMLKTRYAAFVRLDNVLPESNM